MDEFMKAALDEAQAGLAEGGIPIGAVLVDNDGSMAATGRNRRIQDSACVMHAEINCLYNAGKTIQDFRGMTMYSTLMPCHMCAGAIVQFGISRVVVAESENFGESNGYDLMLRHGIEVTDLDLEDAKQMLGGFIESNPQHWNSDIGK
ncbi:MAG: nucleoside deaminase [Dehalococcoidia bacterium]|nr:nucleoside deaminase [Dehalococcoidia bacterium]